MNPDVKIKWLAALRSGEYVQGRGELRTHDGKFCCLGVLCEIIDPSEAKRGAGFLTERGRQLSGLTPSIENILTGMNDLQKQTFSQIADWIEVNL